MKVAFLFLIMQVIAIFFLTMLNIFFYKKFQRKDNEIRRLNFKHDKLKKYFTAYMQMIAVTFSMLEINTFILGMAISVLSYLGLRLLVCFRNKQYRKLGKEEVIDADILLSTGKVIMTYAIVSTFIGKAYFASLFITLPIVMYIYYQNLKDYEIMQRYKAYMLTCYTEKSNEIKNQILAKAHELKKEKFDVMIEKNDILESGIIKGLRHDFIVLSSKLASSELSINGIMMHEVGHMKINTDLLEFIYSYLFLLISILLFKGRIKLPMNIESCLIISICCLTISYIVKKHTRKLVEYLCDIYAFFKEPINFFAWIQSYKVYEDESNALYLKRAREKGNNKRIFNKYVFINRIKNLVIRMTVDHPTMNQRLRLLKIIDKIRGW